MFRLLRFGNQLVDGLAREELVRQTMLRDEEMGAIDSSRCNANEQAPTGEVRERGARPESARVATSHSAVRQDAAGLCRRGYAKSGLLCTPAQSRPSPSTTCSSSFWPMRPRPLSLKTERSCSISARPGTRFQAKDDASCTSGRRNGTWCGACWTPGLRPAPCSCRSCALDNRSPHCWKLLCSRTAEVPSHGTLLALAIRLFWSARCKGNTQD
jgi:hypothetical protein